MQDIEFRITGPPIALKRHRSTRKGMMYDPSAADKKKMWNKIKKKKPLNPLLDPVEVFMIFSYSRPKSHFGSGKNSHILKKTAPKIPTRPDIDNLIKMVLDVNQGKERFILNDSQVKTVCAEKKYCLREGSSFIRIIV